MSMKLAQRALDAPHLQENVPDFFAHFEEGVKHTAVCRDALSFEIVFLEGGGFPGAATMESAHTAVDAHLVLTWSTCQQ